MQAGANFFFMDFHVSLQRITKDCEAVSITILDSQLESPDSAMLSQHGAELQPVKHTQTNQSRNRL